ncbi:mannose-6-phosphate isomerase isoform X1 [Ooceraea biroi]|uniref:mannose-6-phosphate isomerase isoform X1 n=2 Tax=Ooceraea biroi TaxID=2015173 RepID=UPI000F095C79|nr:mannose-6-phosphate isomerase isoform X1 [Ooceraea biroi]XP_026828624.1 mannose-6-phosphate isomerase isoform X1 [Ooceraea biroi]
MWNLFCRRDIVTMELKCAVQTYNWGKRGADSIVATLMKSVNADFAVDEQQTYAELWMGTHENGPSYLKNTETPLHKYIQENAETLGGNTVQTFGSNLPFLFKVLSINRALSIQVHPDKAKAKELHELQPNVYKDPNYKPELAIALTDFEALCGFRPIDEIKLRLQKLPELRIVMGRTNVHSLFEADDSMVSDTLRQCFHSLMTCDSDEVARQLKCLIDRLRNADLATRSWAEVDLLERLCTDFPGDAGCFTIYLFNHIRLKPGEAIYIGPNVPHAYLSGDCVECMACSDNVIRAGLTPKLKDVPTLIQTMSFECVSPSTIQLQPFQENTFTTVFRPPVPEFAVAQITIPPGQACNLEPRSSASILLIASGEAEMSSKPFPRGSVLFIAANEKVEIKMSSKRDTGCDADPLLMFQAFSNI